MEWSRRRQSFVWAIFGSALVTLLVTIGIAIFYKTPTCLDNKQNQGEAGVDCGGPCAKACTADVLPARVRFVRAVVSDVSRTDVIAYVDNPNAGEAAHAVPATVDLYDAQHALLVSKDITFDLTSGGMTPVFVEGVLSGVAPVSQAFLTIHDADVQWIRSAQKPVVPTVQDIAWQGSGTPRVTATLVNPIATPFTNVFLIATVFDANGNAIAASRTVVPKVPSQGIAQAVFTWNVPFQSPPARVEVVPLVFVQGI